MLRITYGFVVSLIFCLITTLTALTLDTKNRNMIMMWTFLSRVSMCVLVGMLMRPLHTWSHYIVYGLVIGALFSITDALMTKKSLPIIITTALGSLVILSVVMSTGTYFRGF